MTLKEKIISMSDTGHNWDDFLKARRILRDQALTDEEVAQMHKETWQRFIKEIDDSTTPETTQ